MHAKASNHSGKQAKRQTDGHIGKQPYRHESRHGKHAGRQTNLVTTFSGPPMRRADFGNPKEKRISQMWSQFVSGALMRRADFGTQKKYAF